MKEIKKELLNLHAFYNEKYKLDGDRCFEGMCDGLDLAIQEIDKRVSEVTFGDLISTAVQAVKGGELDFFAINNQDCCAKSGRSMEFGLHMSADLIKSTIEFIESLYLEAFVIEFQCDISRIKLNDKKTKVVLANGILVSDEIWDMLKNQSGNAQFSMLKGAAVTQKRGK